MQYRTVFKRYCTAFMRYRTAFLRCRNAFMGHRTIIIAFICLYLLTFIAEKQLDLNSDRVVDPVTRKIVHKIAVLIFSPNSVQPRFFKLKSPKNQKQNTKLNAVITIPTNLTKTTSLTNLTNLTNSTRSIVIVINTTFNINELN